MGKKIHCRLKFSQNIYPDKKNIGSGYDLINGCKKTQIGFETIFSWQVHILSLRVKKRVKNKKNLKKWKFIFIF